MATLALEPEPDDAPEFAQAVLAAANLVAGRHEPHEVHAVKVKNWFDSKWLGFSGIGRVALDQLSARDTGVALDAFRQTHVTIPPFSPGRVLEEVCWIKTDAGYRSHADAPPIHPAERRHSARNLQRRIRDLGDSVLCLWYSSGSKTNGQGSVMAYWSSSDAVRGWYFSVANHPSGWGVSKVSGALDSELRAAIEDALAGARGQGDVTS